MEDVRCRLDKVYLEALNIQLSDFNGDTPEDTEVTALRGELESLYSEILPVAQMSAEQQYLEPALRAISAQGVQGKHRSQKTLNYVMVPPSSLILFRNSCVLRYLPVLRS